MVNDEDKNVGSRELTENRKQRWKGSSSFALTVSVILMFF